MHMNTLAGPSVRAYRWCIRHSSCIGPGSTHAGCQQPSRRAGLVATVAAAAGRTSPPPRDSPSPARQSQAPARQHSKQPRTPTHTSNDVGSGPYVRSRRRPSSVEELEEQLEQRGQRAPGPAASRAELLQQLGSASSWTKLAGLVQLAQQQALLDPELTSAALTSLSTSYKDKLAGLNASNRSAVQRLQDTLLAASSAQLAAHSAQHMAHNLASLARLRSPSEAYSEVLVDRLLGRLQDLSGGDQAAVLWALARLAHFPGGHWLAAWLSDSSCQLGDMHQMQLGTCLWALARFKYKPPEEWLQAYWAACHDSLAYMQPASLANIFWAAALLQLGLPEPLLQELLLEVQVKMPAFDGLTMPKLAWALCVLGITPGPSWLRDFATFTLKLLPSYQNPQCYSNTAWALANWRYSPSKDVMDAFCTASLPFLQHMDSTQLPVFVCSLAQLGHYPGHNMACYLLECLHRQHKEVTPRNLAACIAALAQLFRPSDVADSWLPHRKFVVQYAPILADLAAACRLSLRHMGTEDLLAVVQGFAGLRYFPGDAFMVRHEQLCNAKVTDFSVYQITGLRRAYQQLEEVYGKEYGGAGRGQGQ